MSDKAIVHVGENSPEQVAYKLMRDIAGTEGVGLHSQDPNSNREWIIRTYCQCLAAVQHPRQLEAVLAMHQR